MVISIQTIARIYPQLDTDRLTLRGFMLADAASVAELAGDPDVAAMTEKIPRHFTEADAERWIDTHASLLENDHELNFAITAHGEKNRLVGAIGLLLNHVHQRASLSYWLGRLYWNRGYATEAVCAAITHAFQRGYQRVWAMHFSCNPSSGRVMQKAGMRHEGTLYAHAFKEDRFHDCEVYGIVNPRLVFTE